MEPVLVEEERYRNLWHGDLSNQIYRYRGGWVRICLDKHDDWSPGRPRYAVFWLIYDAHPQDDTRPGYGRDRDYLRRPGSENTEPRGPGFDPTPRPFVSRSAAIAAGLAAARRAYDAQCGPVV